MLFSGKKDPKVEAAMKAASDSYQEIFKTLSSSPSLSLEPLALDNAALVIVDMVNGFVKQGALASPNALAINGAVADLARACVEVGMPVACVCDTHTLSSPEFSSYPEHCLEGTEEPALTDEIAAVFSEKPGCSYALIAKNSTNALLEPEFLRWLEATGTSTLIICGVCTDICVQQLALGLKTWFNRNNRVSRIIVPANVVATYDLGSHESGLTGTMALYNMSINGVEICSEITY